MQQTQDSSNDLIQIYRAPRPFAFAKEMVDSMDDFARSPRIRRHVGEQLFEHLSLGRTLSEKTSPGGGVAGNRGERLIEFVSERGGEFAHRRYPAHPCHLLALQSQLEVSLDLLRDVDGDTHQFPDSAAIVAHITAA